MGRVAAGGGMAKSFCGMYTDGRNELPQIFIDYERPLVHTNSVLANVSVIEYK